MNDLKLDLSILVVDDDPPVANSLRRLLRRAGYNVVIAHGGKEAVSLMSSLCPSLVISDYRMPDISGVEVLKKARQLCPKAARILISGYSEDGAFSRDQESDAAYFFFETLGRRLAARRGSKAHRDSGKGCAR